MSSPPTKKMAAKAQQSLEMTDEGADAALFIKAIDGTTALLSFESNGVTETDEVFV